MIIWNCVTYIVFGGVVPNTTWKQGEKGVCAWGPQRHGLFYSYYNLADFVFVAQYRVSSCANSYGGMESAGYSDFSFSLSLFFNANGKG